jgi:hypothetical protein
MINTRLGVGLETLVTVHTQCQECSNTGLSLYPSLLLPKKPEMNSVTGVKEHTRDITERGRSPYTEYCRDTSTKSRAIHHSSGRPVDLPKSKDDKNLETPGARPLQGVVEPWSRRFLLVDYYDAQS